jgi:hypothetical protein
MQQAYAQFGQQLRRLRTAAWILNLLILIRICHWPPNPIDQPNDKQKAWKSRIAVS